MEFNQSKTIPPSLEKPQKRDRFGLIIKVVVLLLIVGGTAVAWFAYPSFQQSIVNLFSDKPSPEMTICLEDRATPVEEPEFSLGTVVGRDRIRFRDINLIRIALVGHYNTTGSYPENINELIPEFIKTIPEDPSGANPYSYQLTDGGYALTFVLEGDIMDLTAGQHELSPEGYDILQLEDEPQNPDSQTTLDNSVTNEFDPTLVVPITATPVSESGAESDTDKDGLDDQKEVIIGTDPQNPDTDGDRLKDGDEVSLYGTNPRLSDTDEDGLNDGDELDSGFDPRQKDVVLKDSDEDGLYDLIEIGRGYNPDNPDMDADGLADGDELNVFNTSAVMADTDGDGYSDGLEIANGFNPLGEGQATDAKQDEWKNQESSYGLHEPSLQTLGR